MAKNEFDRLKEIIQNAQEEISRFKLNQGFYDNKYFVSAPNSQEFEDQLKYVIKANRILPDIHIVANSLKDNKPQIVVIPKDNTREDIEKAEKLQRFIYAFLQKHKFYDENLYKMHLIRLIYGTVGIFSGYIARGDEVEYTLKVLAPYEFFFDPDIESYEEQKYCYLLTFVKTNTNVSTPFDDLKFNFTEPHYYDVFVDYFERGGRHKRFDSKGNVILDEENPYKDRLPIVYSYYYYRPKKYLGYSLIDEWRVYQSVLNIIISKMIKDGLISGVYALTPRGAIDEDIELGSGKIITYDTAQTGINNIPRLDKIEALPQSLVFLYNLVESLYVKTAPLFPIEMGQGATYASGSSKQMELQTAQTSRYFSYLSMNAMFTTLARNIISDINDDVFGYFTEKQFFEYVGDEYQYYRYNFKDLSEFDADIYINVADFLPVDMQTLGTIAFMQMAERSKNPVDYEAQKFMNELYRRYNIAYVSNRSRDENLAKYENSVIEQILASNVSQPRFEAFLQLVAENPDPEAIEQIIGMHEYFEIKDVLNLINQIEPKSYDNHQIHLEVHYDVVKTPEYKKAERWKQAIIDTMIDMHRQMAGGVWSEGNSLINSLVQKIIKKQQSATVQSSQMPQSQPLQPQMQPQMVQPQIEQIPEQGIEPITGIETEGVQ